MVQNHLSRLATPKSWPITKRKGIKFITRPKAGPHKLKESVPLNLVVKELLKHASTSKEVRVVLNQGKVLVDNAKVRDSKRPIGLMDTISVPSTNEYYRVLFGEDKRFTLNKATKENANLKLCRINNKTSLGKDKFQINFSDGRNKIADAKNYKVGDTLVLDLEKNEIKQHLELKKGATVYLVDGKHKGSLATLDEIKLSKDNKAHKIILKKDKETFETLKDYAFIVDKSIL